MSVTLVDRTGQAPYNRTLVNKGVAIGLLTPEQVVTPGVEVISDTAVEVDPQGKTVRLASGRIEPYDALLLATGSTRLLPDTLPGLTAATEAGRVTTLHSLEDAVAVRDLLGTLLAAPRRSSSPVPVWSRRDRHASTPTSGHPPRPRDHPRGQRVRRRRRGAPRRRAPEHVDVAFGRTLTAVTDTGTQLELALDDTTQLTADLLIIAHGTTPTGPAPWEDGVIVDGKLRTATPGVYSAGGVAAHYDTTLGAWRRITGRTRPRRVNMPHAPCSPTSAPAPTRAIEPAPRPLHGNRARHDGRRCRDHRGSHLRTHRHYRPAPGRPRA